MADKIIPLGDGNSFKRFKDMGDGTHAEVVSLSGAGGKKSIRGMDKWFGAVQNGKTFNEPDGVLYNFANYGGGYKREVEAHFTAVRLYWVSRAATPMTGSKSLIGVTEVADISTAASAFHPVMGGAVRNTVVTAPNTLGYMLVTWGGQPTVDHPAANLAPQVRVSDWMPLASIPRTDGGTRPLFLNRNEHDGVSGGKFATFFLAGVSSLRTAIAAARGRIFQTFTGANMVSTPSAVNGAVGTATFEVFPEFRFNVPSVSVIGVGDSTLQCEGLALTGGITSWGMRGCAELSTVTRPVIWASCGAAGKKFVEFWARFVELVTAGYKVDILLVQPLSVNDYNGDIANFALYIQTGKNLAQSIFEYAQDNGIRGLIFMGLLPYNPLTTADDNLRKAYNMWLKDFATSIGAKYLEFEGLGDGATPERWIPAYNYNADGLHQNEAGIEAIMVPKFVSALSGLI
jgi:hypothetical protein